MSERDVRVIETMTRTGICFDDLCDALIQFPYEDIEVIYQRIRREINGWDCMDREWIQAPVQTV